MLVKIIEENNPSSFRAKVQDFIDLSEKKGYKVIDIKYSTCCVSDIGHYKVLYSVLIIGEMK